MPRSTMSPHGSGNSIYADIGATFIDPYLSAFSSLSLGIHSLTTVAYRFSNEHAVMSHDVAQVVVGMQELDIRRPR